MIDLNIWELVDSWLDNEEFNGYYGICLVDSVGRLWVNFFGVMCLYDFVK